MEYAFDLHNHSCLSPCGDGQMTPATLAGMGKLAGLDIMALTDHNSCGNCPAFCQAARAYGLLPIPGMELCTLEEVHVVCLFPTLEAAMAFDAHVRPHLSPLPNDPAIFGPQLFMDADDNCLGEETAFLAGATHIGIYDVAPLVARFGGVAYPAHIDRPSFSLLSNLGLWDSDLGFPRAELSAACPPEGLSHRRDLAGVPTLRGSDAHYLHQIAQCPQIMDIPQLNGQAVLDWISCN